MTPSWRVLDPRERARRRVLAQSAALEHAEGDAARGLRGWRCPVCRLAAAHPWEPERCELCGARGLVEEEAVEWGEVIAAAAAGVEWRPPRRPEEEADGGAR